MVNSSESENKMAEGNLFVRQNSQFKKKKMWIFDCNRANIKSALKIF